MNFVQGTRYVRMILFFSFCNICSQATLGESKSSKANDSVPVFVNFSGQKLVLGTLSPEKFPQLAFDLVFEKEFELSHSWKSGSVFFCGYTTVVQEEEYPFCKNLYSIKFIESAVYPVGLLLVYTPLCWA